MNLSTIYRLNISVLSQFTKHFFLMLNLYIYISSHRFRLDEPFCYMFDCLCVIDLRIMILILPFI